MKVSGKDGIEMLTFIKPYLNDWYLCYWAETFQQPKCHRLIREKSPKNEEGCWNFCILDEFMIIPHREFDLGTLNMTYNNHAISSQPPLTFLRYSDIKSQWN